MTRHIALPAMTNPDVAAAFASYDDEVRNALLGLRRLIFETAAETEGLGDIEEARASLATLRRTAEAGAPSVSPPPPRNLAATMRCSSSATRI